MSLSETQVFVLGIVAMLIASAINLYMQKSGKKLHRAVITSIVFVVAVFLSWLWNPPALPPLPSAGADPSAYTAALLTFAGALLASATAVTGTSTIIYNILLKAVFDRIAAQMLKVSI